MKAQEEEQQAKIAEWGPRIAACRSSGQTVRGWCKERGISVRAYYYWEQRVRQAEGKGEGEEEEKKAEFAELRVAAEETREKGDPKIVARISRGETAAEIYEGAGKEVMELVWRVLRNAE